MKSSKFKCPNSKSDLDLVDGNLVSVDGKKWPMHRGAIPNFLNVEEIIGSDKESLDWYKVNARDYDAYLPLTFETFNVNEDEERMKMIDALDIKAGQRVLELGAGTGRDTSKIISKLGSGEIFIQDISTEILDICYDKLCDTEEGVDKHFFISNADNLPLPDNYFDRIFHFGGFNTFTNRKKAIREIVRVAKPGAQVIVGDENMPVWLRETDFGKVLMNSNSHYAHDIPLADLPIEARNVRLEWIIGGVFYFISFKIGEGEPYADIDFEIPGLRGGTHRKRFFGQLEGVDTNSKQKLYAYAERNGLSVSSLLENMIERLDKV